MPDSIEQIMKKFHVYLANCKENAYSEDELVVSKKKIVDLLDELNHAIYDVCEQYEATETSRRVGLAEYERQAAEVREEALHRAEDIYASSLLYTQKAIADMGAIFEETYKNSKKAFDNLTAKYKEQAELLSENREELTSQLSTMSGGETYLHLIEEIRKSAEVYGNGNDNFEDYDTELEEDEEENERAEAMRAGAYYRSGDEEEREDGDREEKKSEEEGPRSVGMAEIEPTLYEEEDSLEKKLAEPITVEVNDTPRMPEVFRNGVRRRKRKHEIEISGATLEMQRLDAEYFDFQNKMDRGIDEPAGPEPAQENMEAAHGAPEFVKIFGKKKKKKR